MLTSPIALLIALICGGLMMSVPRKKAIFPLLLMATAMPVLQELEIGPLHFNGLRVMVIFGFIRVMSRGEKLAGGLQPLDKLMIAWAAWLFITFLAHEDGAFVFRSGMVYNDLGIYFLLRVFIRTTEDLKYALKLISILLIPVAIMMCGEKLIGKNLYYLTMGGGPVDLTLRHGHFRARGPFGHPILAGTIGAVCMVLMASMWRYDRKSAIRGFLAGGVIVLASGSSGPVLTAMSGLAGLALWKFRNLLSTIRWTAIAGICLLAAVMNDPVYYLVARIDLTGASTSWYRAALIEASITHLNEWWLAGTDYTRNWMSSGVYFSEKHTDITNHFIQMGVWGGLLLVILFTLILRSGFRTVGQVLRRVKTVPITERHMAWTLGAVLFAHTTTFFSVSYYDQTVLFLYLPMAGALALLAQSRLKARIKAAQPQPTVQSAPTPSLGYG